MKRILILNALLFFTARASEAQVLSPYDLGGASKPKIQKKLGAEQEYYKRVHQTSLRLILRGETVQPKKFLEGYQAQYPQDAETAYMLGIIDAQVGNIDAATESMKKALELGLPVGRLVAGPRALFKPLAETELIQSLVKSHSNRPVHGPLVGNMAGSTASFWVRTATETRGHFKTIKIDQTVFG